MVQKVQIQLIDDLTGEKAQETVRFGLDGTAYKIDLTTGNAGKLREALSTYARGARKVHGKSAARTNGTAASGGREEIQRIRQWAQDNGHAVNSRGRISSEIRDAYDTAQH